jgi:hydroxyacylglutathione hydrolase
MGILSGDFVFVGDVGRPDLLETAAGQEGVMESSARTMYESLQIFDQLPEYLQLWPGHGAGSACGKALGAVPESTVGYEKRFNQSIRSAVTEDDFVDFILSGQPEPPLYFARMKRDNKKGPAVLGTFPQPEHMSVPSIIGQVRISNAVILDSRDRDQFMEAHIQGSLLSPLNKQFNTVAGCYIDDDQDIYLIVEEDRLEEAVTDLIRIGLDKVVAYATPEDLKKFSDEGGELFSTDTINFEQVDELLSNGEARLLDVRKASEVEEGGHPEAVNIAHTRLKDRISEIPTDKTLLISCRSGARSAVASAYLESREFVVKYVDDLVEPWLKKHGWDQVSA